jgi:LPXTG-motif cell wall-anchored protein
VTGTIIGIVLAIAALVGLAIGLWLFVFRRKRSTETEFGTYENDGETGFRFDPDEEYGRINGGVNSEADEITLLAQGDNAFADGLEEVRFHF